MKRFLALVIALFIILPTLISCAKETRPEYITVGTKDAAGAVTVVVSPDGNDENADGTEALPYATIQAAVNDIAMIDHSIVSSVTVLLKDGTYSVTSPITVEPASPGNGRTATILFMGEGDATVTGGVTLTSSDFIPATGDTANLFPEADKIVQIDLKNYGYTAEEINALISGGNYFATVPALYSDGELQVLSRYPNDSFISVTEVYDAPAADVSKVTLNNGESVPKAIFFDSEHLERINSWHNTENVFVGGHVAGLEYQTDTKIAEKYDSTPKLVLEETEQTPKVGGVFYFYNIPEELDSPGEYYIDENAVLYYYPTDTFETATLTLPVSKGLFEISTYARVENLTLTSSRGTAITATAPVDVWDCEISEIGGEWAVYIDAPWTEIRGNHITNCKGGGVYVNTGNIETLKAPSSSVYNNHIHNYGEIIRPAGTGISANGVNVTVSHNEICDSHSGAINFSGAYITVEYNRIDNVLTGADNVGAIETSGMLQVDNIIRYNYISNIGAAGIYASLPGYSYYGSSGIQGDNNASYYEAYGNIIETVNGNGIRMDGRNITIRNNLLIGCANWYVMATSHQYALYFKNGETDGILPFEDYIFSPVWKEANPDLASLIFDLNQTIRSDTRGWAVPTGNVIDKNWIHYDRFVRYFDNWGTAPYSIEDTVYRFSPDTIDIERGRRENANLSIYNSRRNTINLEELIATTAAGFVDMDMDRFAQIGRVMNEWKIGE